MEYAPSVLYSGVDKQTSQFRVNAHTSWKKTNLLGVGTGVEDVAFPGTAITAVVTEKTKAGAQFVMIEK